MSEVGGCSSGDTWPSSKSILSSAPSEASLPLESREQVPGHSSEILMTPLLPSPAPFLTSHLWVIPSLPHLCSPYHTTSCSATVSPWGLRLPSCQCRSPNSCEVSLGHASKGGDQALALVYSEPWQSCLLSTALAGQGSASCQGS